MAIAEKDVMQEEDQQPGGEIEELAAPAPAPERVKRGPKKQAGAAASAPAPASQPDPVPAPVAAPAAKAKRKIRVPGYVYWMGLAVLVLIGGFWLVQNGWVISDNIDHPYALLAGPALVVSILALWLIIKFFTAIERGIKSAVSAFKAARAKDESAQFFWIVIAVFLAVSVFASGDFFSKLEKEAIPGLGYATALFIDLVAVQCMRARLNAGRLRDKRGQALYLAGVVMCASASAFANVYTTLTTFNTATSGLLPQWMADFAPWFGLVFPALIVLLSMTADYTLDQTSSKLDPESYKKEEGKRVKLLEYQRDLLRERVEFEHEIDDLAAQLRGRKEKRTFFLIAWLFPVQMSGKQLLKRVEGLYQPQIAALIQQNEGLVQQNEVLRVSLTTLEANAQGAYGSLLQVVQTLQGTIDGQRDTDNRIIVERVENLVAGLRQELAPVAQVEDLREEVQAMASATQIDELASTLRQEMRSLTSSSKAKVNYVELARMVTPLLAKQYRLGEVKSAASGDASDEIGEGVSGDTEEIAALDLTELASVDESDEEEEEGESEVNVEALLKRPSVSIKAAARIVGCDPKYIRTLRDRKRLEATSRNRNLIKTSSIKAYLAERQGKAS
jgi:hypothetical protein